MDSGNIIDKYVEKIGKEKAEMIDNIIKDNVPDWILRLCVYFNNGKYFSMFGYKLEIINHTSDLSCEVILRKRNKIIAISRLNVKGI